MFVIDNLTMEEIMLFSWIGEAKQGHNGPEYVIFI